MINLGASVGRPAAASKTYHKRGVGGPLYVCVGGENSTEDWAVAAHRETALRPGVYWRKVPDSVKRKYDPGCLVDLDLACDMKEAPPHE